MKNILNPRGALSAAGLSLALAGALATPSHAIFGLGAHIAPAYGPEVKGSSGPIMPPGSTNANRISLLTGSASGLQGLGLKFWIDVLPFIDLEATSNIQFGYYDMAFIVDDGTPDTTNVNPGFNIPFTEDKPFVARVSGDAAVLYPFFNIPFLKLSAGGGLSYIAATPVLSSSFARDALTKAEAGGFDAETANEGAISDVLVDALKDEGMAGGIGFFLQAGAKVKPPLIPLAAYANGKYGFGGPSVSGFSGSGLTVELGLAFAL